MEVIHCCSKIDSIQPYCTDFDPVIFLLLYSPSLDMGTLLCSGELFSLTIKVFRSGQVLLALSISCNIRLIRFISLICSLSFLLLLLICITEMKHVHLFKLLKMMTISLKGCEDISAVSSLAQ